MSLKFFSDTQRGRPHKTEIYREKRSVREKRREEKANYRREKWASHSNRPKGTGK